MCQALNVLCVDVIHAFHCVSCRSSTLPTSVYFGCRFLRSTEGRCIGRDAMTHHMKEVPTLWSSMAAARMLDVAPKTFTRLVLGGRLRPAFRTSSGTYLFSPQRVQALKAERDAERGR